MSVPSGTYHVGVVYFKHANGWYEPYWSKGTAQYAATVNRMTKTSPYDNAKLTPDRIRIQSVSGEKLPNAQIQIYTASHLAI